MVRTRNGRAILAREEAKKARKAAPYPTKDSSASTSSSSKKPEGGNPICPQETPDTQKPVTQVFKHENDQAENEKEKDAGVVSSDTDMAQVQDADDEVLKLSPERNVENENADKDAKPDENEGNQNGEISTSDAPTQSDEKLIALKAGDPDYFKPKFSPERNVENENPDKDAKPDENEGSQNGEISTSDAPTQPDEKLIAMKAGDPDYIKPEDEEQNN